MAFSDIFGQALAAAQSDEPVTTEAPFLQDVDYHNRAYMIEEALRRVGALPDPAKNLSRQLPYDVDLKKLIESVPVE